MATSLITNPPYNMKWEPPALAGFMSQYSGYTIPPKQNANYAFILSGLNLSNSRAVFLLPNAVLTSNVKEEQELRRQLIEQNLLLAVISLPPNMFESTSIPTCILVFDKHKETKMIAMIDLSEHCIEEVRDQRGQFGGSSHTGRTYHKTINVIPCDVMDKCTDLLKTKQEESGLCKWVQPAELERNDWNLAPKRYFELNTEISHRPFSDIAADYNRVIAEKNAIQIRMNRTAAKRLGYDCMDVERPDLSGSFEIVGQKADKERNISFGADDGITIKISTKDGIHPLIIDFLNHWKQMIMYLNAEENRYLAEFRDALLPELMSGKIELKGEHSGTENQRLDSHRHARRDPGDHQAV